MTEFLRWGRKCMRLSKVVIGLLLLLLQAAAVYADNNNVLLSNRTEAAGQSVKYSARSTINAGPSYTVDSGASVAMRAGNTITLLPGFSEQNKEVRSSLGITFGRCFVC
jgi:hypothetical protein